MIAVGLGTVNLRQLAGVARPEVEQPLLALLMPDGEIAVVHQREEDILPVVTGARPGQTLPHSHGIEDGIHPFTITARRWVEADLAEVIFLVLIMRWIFLLSAGHIVQGTPVGREDR